MRYSPSEKQEIIRLVEGSSLPVKRTLAELDVPRSSFYRWYRAYRDGGSEGLENRKPVPRRFWNRIPQWERERVVERALARPEQSPRELAWGITDTEGTYISETSVRRILKAYDLIPSPAYVVLSAADKFKNPTKRIHELWQTDFTYLRVTGWGWYYLSSVLDDYSRYIIAWRLYQGMSATDVKDLLDTAVARTGATDVPVRHRPRLLSDNGPCYVSKELREYLVDLGLGHTRSRPYHPMTQGKIERYHRTMKNVVTLRNYYQPGELEREIERFVQYYNHERVHESLGNLTPADVYHGRAREIRTARERIKRQTLKQRKRLNRGLPVRPNVGILPAEIRECVH
jgi:transposase InsO family protein